MAIRVQRFTITFPVSVRTSEEENGLTPSDIEANLSFQDPEGELHDTLTESFSDWTATGGIRTPIFTVNKAKVRRAD